MRSQEPEARSQKKTAQPLRALFWLLVSGSWLLLSTGCAANKQQQEADHAIRDYFQGNYVRAQERLRPAAKKADENFVLNNVRLGSAALVDYDLDEAEDAFLRAYEVINSVGVNEGGRSLGAALVDEKIKVWKGEPYERAMANFYLGIIFYIERDYNNARAAFENALFKLRDNSKKSGPDAVEAEYREQERSFIVADLMVAKCYQRLGRDHLARTHFDRVKDLRPDLEPACDYERN